MESHLSIDIETFSSIDLKKSGLYKYVQSPDFEILLFACSYNGRPVLIIDLAQGEEIPVSVQFMLQDPKVTKHAYNASFEWYCLNKFYPSPLDQWQCTMAHGLYCGYTAGLGPTAIALGLPEDKRKMGVGMSLIRTFCIPCKPTAKNGQRTRTLPNHEPEKWQLFKEYCKQDVVTEMEIERRLSSFPIPDQEQRLWVLDQQINTFGVAVDQELIEGALHCSEVVTGELMEEAIQLSGLDNPKSVQQLTKWLNEEIEEEVTDLRKNTVSELIKSTDNEKAKRMLEIRQELSKTSVKKYNSMAAVVCSDDRVRGLLQYYGANRTGRWAGRLVQIQNLPRNYMETLALARDLVKARKVDALKIIYGNIPDTLSQLIRTAFVPSPGNLLLAADFSAIEARVIAWLAGEQWRLDVFATHGKIYEASASAMFGVPLELIKKGNPEYDLRQKGKVAELACIAEGQLVLTNKGLVPVEKVTSDMLVWDGIEFVTHEGVISRGTKEVITYDGLTATPDHIVWIEGQSEPIRFDESASSGAHLLRPGNSREAIRSCGDYQFGKEMAERLDLCQGANKMQNMREHPMDVIRELDQGQIEGLPAVLSTKANTEMVGQEINSSKAEVYEPSRQRVPELRSEGYKIPFSVGVGSRALGAREPRFTFAQHGDGQDRQQRKLRTRKPEIRSKSDQPGKQENHCTTGMASGGLALCANSCNPEVIGWNDPGTNYRRGETGSERKEEKLEEYRGQAQVYDILNCGPRNRYTVNGALVHNCGYQGGVGALKAMGAEKMGLSDEDLSNIIHRWRSANKRIVDLWYSLENAALEVMRTGQPVVVKRLILAREGDYQNQQDFFTITLPSGRKLYYVKPFLSQNAFGKEALHYYGMDQTTKKWGHVSTYGGKIVENVIQAIARDCLAESITRVDAAGYKIAFHVHDEVVLDVPENDADLERVCALMGEPIPWAPGLLLKADGAVQKFYMKD